MKIIPETVVLDEVDVVVIAEALTYTQEHKQDRADDAHAELIAALDKVSAGTANVAFKRRDVL